ncbi:glutathione S-transferase C-terminal domain-containing protein [Streptomyces iranensis]|uniref:Glutathione S-transferase n=1 Tax=Streptomyces iranensis TaxID=576784 RepID=A0A060ZLQ4_9ACTN|nr:glutathione S-transferase C-terminal domain-containing protein [Streptomyces iranensis]MBP2061932.1 putative glutathione S-transferase [Streptomyces iranensis]CDR03756.1 Glutathione S-transferase domain-containingprotein [Streptomyces iranensis]
MSETFPVSSGPAALLDPDPCSPRPRIAPPAPPHRFRSRIGVDLAGGFYPVPHRYRLYLSASCPLSLRVSITLDLLGLRDTVATTLIGLPDDTPEAYAALRGAYEATWHRYSGPVDAPALCDRWTGRVVSNHAPDILRDLAGHLSDDSGTGRPLLRPAALATDIDALRDLIDADIIHAARQAGTSAEAECRDAALERLLTALGRLDRGLTAAPYALGEELTAADVDLWVALVQLDTEHRLLLDADAADRVSRHGQLRAYVRRLHAHPAFHTTLPEALQDEVS